MMGGYGPLFLLLGGVWPHSSFPSITDTNTSREPINLHKFENKESGKAGLQSTFTGTIVRPVGRRARESHWSHGTGKEALRVCLEMPHTHTRGYPEVRPGSKCMGPHSQLQCTSKETDKEVVVLFIVGGRGESHFSCGLPLSTRNTSFP